MRYLIGLLLAALAMAGIGLWNARADPVVRRAAVGLPDWPLHAPPVSAVLISDIHIGNAAMNARRLGRIVERINALRPDIVFITGDFAAGSDPVAAAAPIAAMEAPLSRLRAPLGVVAVLGNHDHWTVPAQIVRVLKRANVTLLTNAAVRRGPLAIGGLDDDYTGHARPARLYRRLAEIEGARVILSHGPDTAPELRRPLMMLAGHTHCGQIVLPLIGYVATASRYGTRYVCGVKQEPGRTVIVTAGLGTSNLPIRFGAPPDLWMIRFGPRTAAVPTRAFSAKVGTGFAPENAASPRV